MGIVLPCSGADVDHVLHPPRHVLLHLEGHRQGLPHPGPRVRLLNWLNWGCAKEVIVRGSPVKLIIVYASMEFQRIQLPICFQEFVEQNI